MSLLLGVASLIGLTLAAAVHVAPIAGVDVAERVPAVWLLHLGVFAVFIPFVFNFAVFA